MANLLDTSSVMMCPHGGSVIAISSNTRAKTSSGAILRASDTFTIAGCAFNISGAPHPCVSVNWVSPDARTKALDDLTLSQQSIGLCVAGDQAVQGVVLITSTQARVSGM